MDKESLKKFLQGQQKKVTGELAITANNQKWHFYLETGRLLYATGGTHRVRRWYRALKRYSPGVVIHPDASINEPWEYELLQKAVSTGKIQTNQAAAIIQSSIQEVIVEVLGQQTLDYKWNPNKQLTGQINLPNIDKLIENAYQLHMQWQKMGLGQLQPHFVPLLVQPQQLQKQVSPEVFSSLGKLLAGKHSFWDIANEMRQPVTTVTKLLLPFIRQKTIKLQSVPDVPMPSKAAPAAPAAAAATNAKKVKPLIACIDDSPAIGKAMERILTPAGYETIAITDPLKAASILLQRKPDMIFVDLVMPSTNGYELCAALRKTSIFKTTPIVILTAHEGKLDRTRAQKCGASGFMGKPPEPAKVLSAVKKFLGATASKVPTAPAT
ncbi:MAG TPA: response regulator [Candidatus Obscuribacterales bacterium]